MTEHDPAPDTSAPDAPAGQPHAADAGDAATSRAAIVDLVHGYARHIRHREGAAAAALFTADGTFEIREGAPGEVHRVRARLEDRDAILAYLTQGDVTATPLFPVIHNLIVRFGDDGVTATGNSLMQTIAPGGGAGVFGEYHDSFRREGTWRFSGRVFTIYGASGTAAR